MIDNLFKRLSLALVGLSTFTFCFLTLPFSFAENNDTIVDDIIITVPAACSIKDSTGGAGKTYNVSMMPGQYNPNIGSTTIVATCNDASGFALYAIGYGNEEYGNTDLITNLANPGASGTNTGNIVTGTATSGGTSNWAMKLSTQTNPAPTYPIVIQNGFGNFSAVPSTYTLVAKRTSATDAGTGAEGARLNTHYAVYVSPTQVAATYTGNVKYTMVHPSTAVAPAHPQSATPKCISYWPNASGVTDSMADDCNSGPSGNGYGNNASATLWASNFQRPGYGFAGWTDKFDWVLNANDANGNGTGANAGYHIYGPNADITTPADMTTKGLSLYAVWVLNAGNLQSWNGCSTMNTGNVTALTDQRDNNTYAVAKLADGNCWMIENLRLAGQTTSGTPITINSSNTNSPISTFTQLGASVDPTSTAWCKTSSAACDDQSMLFSGNTTNPVANMSSGDANIYSYGNYYNWYSATAGNGTYSTGSNVVTNGDICPTGWHLPYGRSSTGIKGGNTSGGFYFLGDKLGATASSAASSNIWRSYPQNFVYSGYVTGASVLNRGSYGYYWSSTANGNSRSYDLNFSSSSVYPATSASTKYLGKMARCVVAGS